MSRVIPIPASLFHLEEIKKCFMNPGERNMKRENVEREVRELEDAYAEAFADEVDVRSLANMWDHIQELRREVDESERGRSR
jgi:hypothetical protein